MMKHAASLPGYGAGINHQFSIVLTLLSLLLLAGCGGPWAVVTQAQPNPFLGEQRFYVLPVDFSGVRVAGFEEATYLAVNINERDNWGDDKLAMIMAFSEALITKANERGIKVTFTTDSTAPRFQIRPRATFIEPGYYGSNVRQGLVVHHASVEFEVAITKPDGQVLDRIVVHGVSCMGTVCLNNSTVGKRISDAGRMAGNKVAEYLLDRLGLQPKRDVTGGAGGFMKVL